MITLLFYVRGLHNNGTSEAIVIIDGIKRPIDDILPEEIESIQILKRMPLLKLCMESSATNGVILVRTKRGKANERVIRCRIGIRHTTGYPYAGIS